MTRFAFRLEWRTCLRWSYGVLALSLCGVACGSDDDFESVGAGRTRAGQDAGLMDGALPDGASRGGGDLFDGAVLPDGRPLSELPDGGHGGDDGDGGIVSELDVTSCEISDEDTFEVSVPFVEGGFGVWPGTTGFGLAYRGAGSCRDIIDTAPVAAFGPFSTPQTIIDDCRNIRELSLVKAIEGWYLAWTDNSTNTVELHTMRLEDDLAVAAESVRSTLTQNSAFERRPTLASMGERTMLAWFAEQGDERSIWTKVVGSSAEAQEIIPGSAGYLPIELAMAEMGPDHAALAWVDEIQSRGIWLQAIDGEGEAVGTPQRMTDFAAPGSTVDIATREHDGGATVYSLGIDLVNFEVRFRRLHPDASFRGEEVKIISRPLQAKDAGLARVGGGYAVVYRAIPDGRVITEPQIRLAFVTREGNVTRDDAGRIVTLPIVPAARDGSRIQVELSVDGKLLIAFVDGNDMQDNTLRLLRRRLDCGFER